MPSVSARDALDYATDDELLKLYGVLAGGWVLIVAGQFVAATVGSPAFSLLGILVVLAGALAFPVGVVAILRKVIAES